MQTDVAINASLTATNAALAAQSAENARQARIERCKVELLQYEPKAANAAQMQSYASCVQIVYPESEESSIAWKWIIAAVMIIIVVGAVIGALRDTYDLLGGVVGGALAGACISGVLLLFGLGIAFVIS
ncbi:MAG: hypothetical protein NTX28_07560 [Novosphingobium sp.]|nr:hypothetical protein [Novosphingobium sp.]